MPERQFSYDDSTRYSILQGAVNEDTASWDLIFTLYGPLIKNWAKQCNVVRSHDIENVCQEVFAKIVMKLPSFKNENRKGAFRSWLKVITRNHICSSRTGDSHFQIVGDKQWQEVISRVSLTRETETKSLLESGLDIDQDEKAILFKEIMAWVGRNYSDKQVKVFKRVVIDQVLARDVADELETTPNVVYQIKSRILARIREVFGPLV